MNLFLGINRVRTRFWNDFIQHFLNRFVVPVAKLEVVGLNRFTDGYLIIVLNGSRGRLPKI